MYKEFCSTAIQTDDLGCNNGCTSMYIDTEPCAVHNKPETSHQVSFIPVHVLVKKLERIPQHKEIESDMAKSAQYNNKDSSTTSNTLPEQNTEYDLVNVEHRFEYSVKYAESCDIPNGSDHNETETKTIMATGSAISTALHGQELQPTEGGSNVQSHEDNKCCQEQGLTSQSYTEKEQRHGEIHSQEVQRSLQEDPIVSEEEDDFGDTQDIQEPNRDSHPLVFGDSEKSQYILSGSASMAQESCIVGHDTSGSVKGHLGEQEITQSEIISTETHTKSQHKNSVSFHRKPSLSCSFCDKEFRGQSKLLRHVRSHTGEKPFTCLHCPKKFGQKTHLNNHLKVHNDEKSFQCSYCVKKFRDKTCFKYHLKTHTGKNLFECPQCHKRYPRQCDMTRHLKVHSGERPFECERCGRRFTYKHDMKRHERVHTGEKRFGCSRCDKRFARKNDLTNHERIHSGEKPFRCSHCDKSFTQRQHLRQHIKVHTGEMPYECDQCGKGFSQRTTLTAHLLMHSGENPHQCAHCKRKFANKGALTRHMEIHELKTDDKPSECTLVQEKVES